MKVFNYPEDIDPATIVSEIITTNSNQMQHQILTEPYDATRKPPLFFKGSIDVAKIPHYVSQTKIPSLSITSFPRGVTVGRGIHLTQDDEPIFSRPPMLGAETRPDWLVYWTGGGSVEQLIERKRNGNLNGIDVAAPCVCIGFCHILYYGHWLIDFLPMVHMVQRFSKGPIRWIFPNVFLPWMKELLNLLLIDQSQCLLYNPKTEYIASENLIFVTSPHYGWFLHPMINSMVDRIFENANIPLVQPYRKIFVSRSRLKHSARQLVNYEEVESLFEEKGFTIIHPEGLSLLEQIKLFSQAKIVAGETGSGMNNTLFSPSACDVLLLQSNARRVFNQAAICDVRGQRIGYVFGDSLEPEPPTDEDRFILDLGTVGEGIDEMLAGR